MSTRLLRICCALLLAVAMAGALTSLVNVYQWSYIDFTFPSPASRQAMIQQGLFIPNNSIPFDVDFYSNRVFITLPRLKKGIPATLATVSNQGVTTSPLLVPYPNWSWHKPGNCDGMTSVFRVKVDECGRMWVLDTGSINIFTGIRHVCPKQLLVFNMTSDRLIRRHRFPQRVIKPDTLLVTVAVDVRDRNLLCRDTFVYAADTTTYGLLVYDARNDRSWRIAANNFWPIPAFGFFTIANTLPAVPSTFDLMDGIAGLAISPYTANIDRILYYHSLASNTENSVLISLVQNETYYANDGNKVMRSYTTFPNTRLGQSAAEAMTTTGVLFYSDLVSSNLVCWKNTGTYLGLTNPVVDVDTDQLQFVSGIKAVPPSGNQVVEYIWVVSNKLQQYIDGTMNNVVNTNFRVFKQAVSVLVTGTSCA